MDASRAYSKTDLMRLAIEEHLKCTQFPRVGAVVTKDGIVLSTGHRGERGNLHAERIALEKLSEEDCRGATVYTTLEPCVALHDGQTVGSCAELLVESGVAEVVIGVLDPNATIYSQGYRKLLENNIAVSFFNRKLRAAVEEETFDVGRVDKLVGSGKRRVPVVHSGIELTVHFSESDTRTIPISWRTLQPMHGFVDLGSRNGAIRVAAGVRDFGDVTDPKVFRFPSHYARMTQGMIAIVQPEGCTFYVLIQLLQLFDSDILFRWECRNDR
ncbi:deaminase [Caballeronia sp. LP003]|uniref:deaminase n=1 Tax=Caballeronia sp. LP003 TaxID=3038551 RepID=UPI0028645639|nr:deaminase [Caballeronia sp. LP003]MDR5785229.1 deaminase [Caballeronia sp. LP003]